MKVLAISSSILWILWTCQPTATQTIDIRQINNQSLIALDHGPARIQNGSYYYLHHFNLTSIRIYVDILNNQFENLSPNLFSPIISQQFKTIHLLLQRLSPIRRQKRWDRVGTIWKYIAGTPDAEDLKVINSSINNLISNNNQQVKINREITLQLKEVAFKTKEAIQLFNSKTTEFNAISILENLKVLSQKLEHILETITLAKIGILNTIILSDNEITTFIHDLAREKIIVVTAAEAISYASTSIATNQKEIALLIKLPKLDSKIYQKIHIHPITHNNQQLHLPNRNFLVHNNETLIANSLKSNIFKLSEVRLETSTCIPNLLQGQPATCNYTMNPTSEEVVTIDDQHLLINTVRNLTIKSNCGLSERNLSGAYLISYDNCTVNVSSIMVSNIIQHLTGKPIHLSLDGLAITKGKQIFNLSLEHLNLLQTETRRDLEQIRLENNSIQWTPWSIFGTFSFTPTVIGLAIFFSILAHRKAMKIQFTQPSREVPITTDMKVGFQHTNLEDVIRTEPHHLGRAS
nr:uncharacterized protein LOC115257610 [Aedes albopictus]